MNVERADPSYTAWDNAIVAKFKGRGAAAPGPASATSPKDQDNRANQQAQRADKTFNTALAHANEHEHAYDPSQRNQDDDSFGFWDFIDIINPLQHIPVVSTIYRDLTGDTISAPARIAGGMLYGGPLGFASSIGNAIVEETSGQDVGEIAMAVIFDEEAVPDNGGTAVASAVTGPADPQLTSAREAETLSPQTVATPANEGPAQRENAGSAAVSQMQANNAALQALLKDMGLGQATASAVPAPDVAAQPASSQSPANTGGIAQVASAAASAPAVAAPERNTAANAQQVQSQTEPPKQRKSIPIDPRKYINTRRPAVTAATAKASQATATNGAVTDAARTAATTVKSDTVEITGRNQNSDTEDRKAIQSSFADRMLGALDRYQSMSQQRSALPEVGSGGTPGAI